MRTKKTIKILFPVLFFVFCFVAPVSAQSEEKMTLTVTPPLIKINLNPGETWSSSIKVVNNNPEPVSIVLETMDFKSSKDGGVEFIEESSRLTTDQEIDSYYLSTWIEPEAEELELEAQSSKNINFTINVPEDASPGGHYASILVGSQPGDPGEGSGIAISSMLASLIMLNINGEVIEKGDIREFSVPKVFFDKPDVDFSVRFENVGNVHLQPRGEIRIFDWFDKEKGQITINHGSEFGHVLPKSTRSWDFNWQDEKKLLEMGRYKATLVFSYGEEAQETVFKTIYFWIIDFKITFIILGSILIFVLLSVYLIRLYINKSVLAVQKKMGVKIDANKPPKKVRAVEEKREETNVKTVVPRGKKSNNDLSKMASFAAYFRYLKVISVIILVLFISFAFVMIFREYKNSDKQETILLEDIVQNIDQEDNSKDKNIENYDIDKKEVAESASSSLAETSPEKENDELIIKVLNGSGISGAAGKISKLIKEEGYVANTIGNAPSFDFVTTIIKHKSGKENVVAKISNALPGLTETELVEDQEEDIIIIIGKSIEE